MQKWAYLYFKKWIVDVNVVLIGVCLTGNVGCL